MCSPVQAGKVGSARRRSVLGALCGVVCGWPLMAVRAQDSVVDPRLERSVKAAFLFKFLAYVDFPPAADGAVPMSIGVAGSDAMAAELVHTIGARNVNGRAIQVRQIKDNDLPPALDVLFLAGADEGRHQRWLKSVAPGTLTVTESDSGLAAGSVINFRIVDERVRFEVSLDAAERQGIKLSSRLLSVALRVLKGAS